jgi:hypothetical protein
VIVSATVENERARLPLSAIQRSFYLLQKLAAEGVSELGSDAAYNFTVCARIDGALDAAALSTALSHVVGQHACLRSIFAEHDGLPYQVVTAATDLPLRVEAVPAGDEGAVERWVTAQAEADMLRSFDLGQWPLLRAGLYQSGPALNYFVLTVHHIVWDMWSWWIFWREVTAAYRAAKAGEALPRQERKVSYADYVAHQQQELARSGLERERQYWLESLQGAPGTSRFPATLATAATASPSFGGRTLLLELPAATHAFLQRFALENRASPFVVSLALLELLLFKYTGQTTLLIGSPFSGRNFPGSKEVVGPFVNTVVLKSTIDPELSLREFVRKTRDVVVAAYEHQGYPFNQLVRELNPAREGTRNPLFQVMFNLKDVDQAEKDLSGTRVTFLALERKAAKFDLTIGVSATREAWALEFEYDANLYTPQAMDRLAKNLVHLAESLARDPECSIAELDVIAIEERAVLLAAIEAQGRVVHDVTGRPVPLGAWGHVSAREEFDGQRVAARCLIPEKLGTEASAGKLGRFDQDGKFEWLPVSAEAEPEPPEAPQAAGRAEQIATIWEQVLGKKIGPESYTKNFFQLGGNSLLLMQVIGRMQTQLGIKQSPVKLLTRSLLKLAEST